MSLEELIELAKRIKAAECGEEEHAEIIALFNANVPHPNGANLFYYPENYNARRDNLSEYNPTAEEVVDKALSYRSIVVPPSME